MQSHVLAAYQGTDLDAMSAQERDQFDEHTSAPITLAELKHWMDELYAARNWATAAQFD